MGPRLRSVDPPRASFGDDLLVAADGLATGTALTLARGDGDPAGPPEGWAMTVIPTPPPPPGAVRLAIPRPDLAPGARQLEVTVTQGGLLLGSDSIAFTVVPVVKGPSTPLQKGVQVDLDTAHAAPDLEVFLGGVRLAPAEVAFGSPTEVSITIPAATPSGTAEVALRAAKVAGPTTTIEVAP
jgi:hypothetical protein